jgi:hypothetical protein
MDDVAPDACTGDVTRVTMGSLVFYAKGLRNES